MTALGLVLRGLRYHWRAHLGALWGAVLSAAVLAGAFLLADSLRGTLRRQGEARIGRVVSALSGGEKFFQSGWADRVGKGVAPVLLIAGNASKPDGSARLNRVQVLGVDDRFWELSQRADRRELRPGDAAVSRVLADRMGLALGETLIVRMEKPSLFSRDAPLSGEEEALESVRVRVVAVLDEAHFGRFSLQAEPLPPANVFVSLSSLQERLEIPGRANLLLSPEWEPEVMRESLLKGWTLEDAGLRLQLLPDSRGQELRTDGVFFEPGLMRRFPKGVEGLTYFVNELRSGERSTPYSMVAAAEPGAFDFLPQDLGENEIVVSQWLAEDLRVDPGQAVTLKYYVMGPRRRLEERSETFRIREVVAMGARDWDGAWMPDFPGLSEAGNCRDWKPGFALSLDRIREVDEQYWKRHRGTPKAFVGLKKGQQLWSNRWGQVSTVRYPRGGVEAGSVLSKLSFESLGFQVLAVRQLATAAMEAPVDFAGLFAGFSFFLIAAALALVALLFGLMIQKRSAEAGILVATGWEPRRVRRLFLGEGLLGLLVGSVVGACLGVGYARVVLSALSGVWRGATGGGNVDFYWEPRSLLLAVGLNMGFAWLGMVWACRRFWVRPPLALLAGGMEEDEKLSAAGSQGGSAGRSLWWSLGLGLPGLGLLAWTVLKRDRDPVLFFSGGSLCFLSALSGFNWGLRRLARGAIGAIRQMAWRNAGRRAGRSLILVGVLAAGAFLVLSVEVFRKGTPGEDEGSGLGRGSGTGGFALLGQLASPVYEDLNRPEVRDNLGVSPDLNTRVWMVREKSGEEASCLNLNRAVQPRVLGVPSRDLEAAGVFGFTDRGASWAALRGGGEGWIPVVADEASILWAMKKRLGDEVELADGRGGRVRLRLVAALRGSVLQGALLMDAERFEQVFPDVGGYRVLWLETPRNQIEATRKEWSRALADRGLELVGAEQRLAELNAVSNTYLSIFQVLGGLGVLLGALGVGVVALRNIRERGAELAILEVTGWRTGQIRRLLFWEHGLLALAGLAIGGGCAILATGPGQWLRGEPLNWGTLVPVLGVLVGSALGSLWGAIRWGLPPRASEALRRE
jgi:putative ABC transport system permease protein